MIKQQLTRGSLLHFFSNIPCQLVPLDIPKCLKKGAPCSGPFCLRLYPSGEYLHVNQHGLPFFADKHFNLGMFHI